MIVKNSIIIGIFTVFSILLGLLRDRLLAHFVGVGQDLDVFNAAFRIPDLSLGMLFAFVSSATVIPLISKSIQEKNTEMLQARISSLFFFFGIVMLATSVTVVAILPYIAHLIVPGFDELQKSQYTLYTRILMLQPFFLGLSTLLSTVSQAKQRFYIYGTAPLLYTGSIIFSIFFYNKYGLLAIISGVVAGAIFHFMLQATALYQDGYKLKYSIASWTYVKEQLKISVPRSGSIIITQLRALFFVSFATTLGVGILSAYIFALRIKEAVILLIPQTLATASIPMLAQKSSQEDKSDYLEVVKKHILTILAVSIAASLSIFLLRKIIVGILYGQTIANNIIQQYVTIFMIALPFACFNYYVSNALSASCDTKTYFYANALVTPTVIFAALYFRKIGLGYMSIVYAVSMASVLMAFSIIGLLAVKKYIYEY